MEDRCELSAELNVPDGKDCPSPRLQHRPEALPDHSTCCMHVDYEHSPSSRWPDFQASRADSLFEAC